MSLAPKFKGRGVKVILPLLYKQIICADSIVKKKKKNLNNSWDSFLSLIQRVRNQPTTKLEGETFLATNLHGPHLYTNNCYY